MNDPVDSLRQIARALGPLLNEVVFVGGAAAPLVISDPGSEGIRPTDDIDVIVEAESRVDYARLEARLRSLGFRHDTSEGAPICRFVYDSIPVDVMPTNPEVLGFSNRWYPYALASKQRVSLPGGPEVRVANPVAFIATKLEAFQSPGREHAGDVLASRDLEDIVTVLDGSPSFAEAFAGAPDDVRAYLRKSFAALLEDETFIVSVEGLVPPGPTRVERARRLIVLLRELVT
ncbi:MAG: nucleotidyl transferase AbiEii/AbiGii toxin family protein [Bacteroidota bacterium]